MTKVCPSCGYGPIGPFTDNCPICAEPVRNVRSGGGGGARSWPRVVWLLLGGLLVAVLIIAGCCAMGVWWMGKTMQVAQQEADKARAEAEAQRKARTVVVTAADLAREFRDDPAAADRKYAGKYLELAGVVERVGRGRHGQPFAVLRPGDEKSDVRIECFFIPPDEVQEAQVAALREGETVTVRGEYDGRVTNVQLRECVLAGPPRP